ncbi:hypothetical protein Tco_0871673 [Tanacetum coccineum]
MHISQLSPFVEARVSHFEVLTRVFDLSPSVTVLRAFYTRTYSDGLFSFAKRSTSAPVLEKDSAPHLTARQEQIVKLLESHKAPFRRYPECFLCLVGLSPYRLVWIYQDRTLGRLGGEGSDKEMIRLGYSFCCDLNAEIHAPTEEGYRKVLLREDSLSKS